MIYLYGLLFVILAPFVVMGLAVVYGAVCRGIRAVLS